MTESATVTVSLDVVTDMFEENVDMTTRVLAFEEQHQPTSSSGDFSCDGVGILHTDEAGGTSRLYPSMGADQGVLFTTSRSGSFDGEGCTLDAGQSVAWQSIGADERRCMQFDVPTSKVVSITNLTLKRCRRAGYFKPHSAKSPVGTCWDGQTNGWEEGVDCGKACENLCDEAGSFMTDTHGAALSLGCGSGAASCGATISSTTFENTNRFGEWPAQLKGPSPLAAGMVLAAPSDVTLARCRFHQDLGCRAAARGSPAKSTFCGGPSVFQGPFDDQTAAAWLQGTAKLALNGCVFFNGGSAKYFDLPGDPQRNNVKVGSALTVQGTQELVVEATVFEHNFSPFQGGALFAHQVMYGVKISSCSFLSNMALDLDDDRSDDQSTAVLVQTVAAGAIMAKALGQFELSTSLFLGNAAGGSAGAVLLDMHDRSRYWVDQVRATDATPYSTKEPYKTLMGGDLDLFGKPVRSVIHGCTFDHNVASGRGKSSDGKGGAIATALIDYDPLFGASPDRAFRETAYTYARSVLNSWQAPLSVVSCNFQHNVAKEEGGAVFAPLGGRTCQIPQISSSDQQMNFCDGRYTTHLAFRRSNFSNNTARMGGALFLGTRGTVLGYEHRTSIDGCHFTANKAAGVGGAVLFASPHALTRVNATSFLRNEAAGASALMFFRTRFSPSLTEPSRVVFEGANTLQGNTAPAIVWDEQKVKVGNGTKSPVEAFELRVAHCPVGRYSFIEIAAKEADAVPDDIEATCEKTVSNGKSTYSVRVSGAIPLNRTVELIYSAEYWPSDWTACPLHCPRGWAAKTGGLRLTTRDAQCEMCGPGKFNDIAGETATCTTCPPGTYTSASGGISAASCQICPQGKLAAENNTMCFAHRTCVKGEKQVGADPNIISDRTCVQCGRGTFSASDNERECTSCPPNFYSRQDGAVACVACAVGQQSPRGAFYCSGGTCTTGVSSVTLEPLVPAGVGELYLVWNLTWASAADEACDGPTDYAVNVFLNKTEFLNKTVRHVNGSSLSLNLSLATTTSVFELRATVRRSTAHTEAETSALWAPAPHLLQVSFVKLGSDFAFLSHWHPFVLPPPFDEEWSIDGFEVSATLRQTGAGKGQEEVLRQRAEGQSATTAVVSGLRTNESYDFVVAALVKRTSGSADAHRSRPSAAETRGIFLPAPAQMDSSVYVQAYEAGDRDGFGFGDDGSEPQQQQGHGDRIVVDLSWEASSDSGGDPGSLDYCLLVSSSSSLALTPFNTSACGAGQDAVAVAALDDPCAWFAHEQGRCLTTDHESPPMSLAFGKTWHFELFVRNAIGVWTGGHAPNAHHAERSPSGLVLNGTEQATKLREACQKAGHYLREVPSVSAACVACAPGTFCTAGRSLLCAPGTYSDIFQASLCKTCVAGKTQDAAGKSTCHTCPLSAASKNTSAPCKCVSGYYSRHASKATADVSSSSSSSNSSSSMSDNAADGTAAFECVPCGPGASCSDGRFLVKPGYWAARVDAREVYTCLDPIQCVGSRSSSDARMTNRSNPFCAEHHVGVLCAECARGFTKNALKRCRACSPNAWDKPLIVAGISLAIFASIISLTMCRNYTRQQVFDAGDLQQEAADAQEDWSMWGATCSLLIVHFQRLSSFSVVFIAIQWPDQLKEWFKAMSAAGMRFMSLLKIVSFCSFDLVFKDKILVATFFFLWVAGILGSVYLVAASCQGRFYVRKCFRSGKRPPRLHIVKARLLRFFVLFYRICVPEIADVLLNVFGCRTVSAEIGTFLVVDVSVECFSAHWWSFATVAIIALSIYIVAFPSTLLTFILRARRQRHVFETARRLGRTRSLAAAAFTAASSAEAIRSLSRAHSEDARKKESMRKEKEPKTKLQTLGRSSRLLSASVRKLRAAGGTKVGTILLAKGKNAKDRVSRDVLQRTEDVFTSITSRFKPRFFWWFFLELGMSIIMLAVLSTLAFAPIAQLIAALLVATVAIALSVLSPFTQKRDNTIETIGTWVYFLVLLSGVLKHLAKISAQADGSTSTSQAQLATVDELIAAVYITGLIFMLVATIIFATTDFFLPALQYVLTNVFRALRVDVVLKSRGRNQIRIRPVSSATTSKSSAAGRRSRDRGAAPLEEEKEHEQKAWLESPKNMSRCPEAILVHASKALQEEYRACWSHAHLLQQHVLATNLQRMLRGSFVRNRVRRVSAAAAQKARRGKVQPETTRSGERRQGAALGSTSKTTSATTAAAAAARRAVGAASIPDHVIEARWVAELRKHVKGRRHGRDEEDEQGVEDGEDGVDEDVLGLIAQDDLSDAVAAFFQDLHSDPDPTLMQRHRCWGASPPVIIMGAHDIVDVLMMRQRGARPRLSVREENDLMMTG